LRSAGVMGLLQLVLHGMDHVCTLLLQLVGGASASAQNDNTNNLPAWLACLAEGPSRHPLPSC
jgi:hypothetical protein